MHFPTVRTPKIVCADCGHEMDAASGFGKAKPKPGDISICMYCGHIAAFADDMTVRPLTVPEMIKIAGDKRIVELRQAIYEVWKDKKKP